jgi:hypothetical protein
MPDASAPWAPVVDRPCAHIVVALIATVFLSVILSRRTRFAARRALADERALHGDGAWQRQQVRDQETPEIDHSVQVA